MIKRIKNTPQDIQLLSAFLRDAGISLKSFRYFGKRPLEIIQNHLYTVLVLNEKINPIGYGHLDPQDDSVWLGICVAENQVGKGYGKIIMTELTQKADFEGISELILQVDKANISAVSLYKTFNFIITEEKDGLYLIMKRTSNVE